MQAVGTHSAFLQQNPDLTVQEQESRQVTPYAESFTPAIGARVTRQAPPVQWEPHVQRLTTELSPYMVSSSLLENIRPDEHEIYRVEANGGIRFFTFVHDRAVQVDNFNPKERSWRIVNASTGRADGPEITERSKGEWGIDRQGGHLWNDLRGLVRDAADKVAQAYHVLKNNRLSSRMLINLKKLFGPSVDNPQGKTQLLDKLKKTWQALKNSEANGGKNLYTTPYFQDGSDESADAHTSASRVIFSELQLENRPRGLLVGKMIHEINHADGIGDVDNWYVTPSLGRMAPTYDGSNNPLTPFTFDNAIHNPDSIQYGTAILTEDPQLGLMAMRVT